MPDYDGPPSYDIEPPAEDVQVDEPEPAPYYEEIPEGGTIDMGAKIDRPQRRPVRQAAAWHPTR
jgi:hypothetical protein